MIYLTYSDLLHIAERVIDDQPLVRDVGLLESAAARPQIKIGAAAYPSLEEKVTALVHSIARNRALVDGNKRLALGAASTFLGINGWRLTATNDEAYDFIIDIATGTLDDVASIAQWLKLHSEPR